MTTYTFNMSFQQQLSASQREELEFALVAQCEDFQAVRTSLVNDMFIVTFGKQLSSLEEEDLEFALHAQIEDLKPSGARLLLMN